MILEIFPTNLRDLKKCQQILTLIILKFLLTNGTPVPQEIQYNIEIGR